MKVVLISFLYEPSLGGGAASSVYSLAHNLVEDGNDVTVITSAPNRTPLTEHQDGIKIIRFFPPNLYWINNKDKQPICKKIVWQLVDIWNPFVYRTIRHLLEAEQPDLVHVQKLRGLSPSVWTATRSVQSTKLAHTCQDYELISPEGLLNGKVGKWAQERTFIMRPYQNLRASFSSQVAIASAPTRLVLNMHTEMGFFKNSQKRIIPNSHGFKLKELNQLREIGLRNRNQPLRLLYLGRLVPEKGVADLCKAFITCSKKISGITLDIAGWGPMENLLKKQFDNFDNIHFHGSAFGDKKDSLLRNSDLVILPSVVGEVFGIVLAEAYAYGKPVIASRIGGIPEVVQEGVTGYLFTPGDVDDLAEKIQLIAVDPSKLVRLSEACFEAARKYASDVILQQYLDMYREA